MVSILSIIGWEVTKRLAAPLFQTTMYRREANDVVIKVTPVMWDRDSISHFESKGYTREYPIADKG